MNFKRKYDPVNKNLYDVMISFNETLFRNYQPFKISGSLFQIS